MYSSAIEHWHACVASNDFSRIEDWLADDAIFLSPAAHTPQVGKAVVAKYLRAAMPVLINGGFHYTGEWLGDHSAVLEFECEYQGVYVNGVDMISWNDAGRIEQFKVMMRPLRALNVVTQMMGRRLQESL